MEITEAFSPGRALTHGVTALRRAPLSVLVGGLLIFIVGVCSGGGGGGNVDLEEATRGQSPEVSLAILIAVLGMLALSIVFALVFFAVKAFLLPGWMRLQRHVVEHGTDNLPLLFSGADSTLRMLGWLLLDGLVRFGTFIVAAAPGAAIAAVAWYSAESLAGAAVGLLLAAAIALPVSIYVGVGLRLGALAVALEGLGPVAALDRSWELARGNRLGLWIFFVVTDLFSLLGALLCGIGMFVTRAIADVGVTESFLLATNPAARDWVIPAEREPVLLPGAGPGGTG